MAVSRARPIDIPADAVQLTEEEAYRYQSQLIEKWEETKEVWALQYAPGVLGISAAFGGIFINNHYRNKLRLGTYGKFSSYLPIVVLPALFSVISHQLFVQRSILLQPMAKCPLCITTRAAAVQAAVGGIYPMVLAPLAGFMFATRHFTYRLPSLTEQPRELLQTWAKLTRPALSSFYVLLGAQGLVAMYLTYKELEQFLKLQIKLMEIEKQAEQDLTLL